jgi:cytochrome P450
MLGTALRGGDPAAGKMLVVTDGPRHSALRRLLASGFGPRMLSVVAAAVEASTAQAVAEGLRLGVFDFAQHVASHIPLTAICELLGVPVNDRANILALTGAAMSSGATGEPTLESRIAQSEILQYYSRLARERRQAPGADIVTLLATGTVDGRALTEEEVLLNCYNLIIGGDETARLAMSGGVLALIDHPEQWRRLKNDAGLVDTGCEEILRWTTPAAHVARTAASDTPLHSLTISAGEIVTLWNTSANRDGDVFQQPDAFLLGRTPNKHVTFGYGPHFCIGAHLARVELRALLRELRRTVRSIESAGVARRCLSNFITGVTELPVRMTAA